jgi:hypothetical protein
MVVDNFDIMGFVILPDKADAPLIVNPDTHPVLATAFKGFQTITGRIFQIVCGLRRIKLAQLPQGPILNIAGKSFYLQAVPDFFCIFAGKRPDHAPIPSITVVRVPYNIIIQKLLFLFQWRKVIQKHDEMGYPGIQTLPPGRDIFTHHFKWSFPLVPM